MKTCFLIIALGAACIGPTPASSATSYGYTGQDIHVVEGMDVFCYQARADAASLGEPMRGYLATLCA